MAKRLAMYVTTIIPKFCDIRVLIFFFLQNKF